MADVLGAPRGQVLLLVARFGAVGVLNTVFGYGVFAALILADAPPGLALAGSAAAGVAFNYQTFRRLVFRQNGRAWRFAALYVGVLTLNWLALRSLHAAGVADLVAQAALTLPMAALSFLGQKLFVFTGRN